MLRCVVLQKQEEQIPKGETMWDRITLFFRRAILVLTILAAVVFGIVLFTNPEAISRGIGAFGQLLWSFVLMPLVPVCLMILAIWLIAGQWVYKALRFATGKGGGKKE